MEDVYTIKVKTKPDRRNLYPSERRYSASTVSGLAWVHLALAATSFLLACLALVNPHSEIKRMTLNDTEERIVNTLDLFNFSESSDLEKTTNGTVDHDSSCMLVLAPCLITVFATAAGMASIMASFRWYIDRNITWLFIMSILSTLVATTSLVMIITWFIVTSDMDFSEFYKDKIPFKDQLVVKHSDVLVKNDTHMLIALNNDKEDDSYIFTKRVLSINIMIAAFLEILWSILSVKISYKGMKSKYKDDPKPKGTCIVVVTTKKGNNTKNLPRNAKIVPPKPDLVDHNHNPSMKIRKIYLAQSVEELYIKKIQKDKANPNSETYNDRVINFLKRCDSESYEITPSVSEALNTIPEATIAQLNQERDQSTPTSWGDSLDHTIYNQNNINFEKIFNFGKPEESEVKMSENV